MPSDEFLAFRAEMAAVAGTASPPTTLAERRRVMEAAMARFPVAAGVRVTSLDADGVPIVACVREDGHRDPPFLYFHGGGYRQGSAASYRSFGSHLARVCCAQVLVVDYRLAPEHPFPAAVDDAFSAYRWLRRERADAPSVVVGGDSSGGGLAAALVLRVRDEALSMPAGLVCMSPWTDLANTGASFVRCAASDGIFSKPIADETAAVYLDGADSTDPLASPLYGNWSGLPPLFLQVSEAEVLADDATRLAERARRAGVDVELHAYPEMPHVWQLHIPRFPEAVRAVDEIARFVARVTGGVGANPTNG